MFKQVCACVVSAMLLVCTGIEAASTVPKAIFISPAGPDHDFWTPVTAFMQKAADNLSVSLDVVYSNDNHLMMIDKVRDICAAEQQPDYLILVSHRDATPIAIRLADECGVATVLYNGAFSPEVAEELRTGPLALKHWKGSVLPDEYQSGYLLAEALIEEAREKGLHTADGKIHVAGLNGALRSFTSVQRAEGLQEYARLQTDVVLEQIVPAFWKHDKARDLSGRLLKRYPETTVLWSASDRMALGAIEAIRAKGKLPGRDILSAGIDWTSDVFESIENGEIVGSVGGHLFDGAWVMVMVVDHFNGYINDFFDVNTQFSFTGKDHLMELRTLLDEGAWARLDFRRYSQHYGATEKFEFGADLILQQMREPH